MWRGTGSTIKWNLSCYSPRIPNLSSFVCFLLICSPRGGATPAVLSLDTAVDKGRKKMADRVARSQARLCSRDGIFCFLPCSLLFFFYLPPLPRYVSLLRVASSVQQSSAPLQQACSSMPRTSFVLYYSVSSQDSCFYPAGGKYESLPGR